MKQFAALVVAFLVIGFTGLSGCAVDSVVSSNESETVSVFKADDNNHNKADNNHNKADNNHNKADNNHN